jgi:hypothetical protein
MAASLIQNSGWAIGRIEFMEQKRTKVTKSKKQGHFYERFVAF